MNINKDLLEQWEEEWLGPCAMKSGRAQRPFPLPEEGKQFVYRTAYQRDRDRIVHSRAFRRLRHKTQVFIPYEGDHFRNRLTHTMEVAQIGRTVARALRLNEDLVEAIALGHDLGHPAFGHSGESILNQILTGQVPLEGVPAQSLKKLGGFKHNYQSVRVVDLLERQYDHPGLNLTHDVREGIWKHTSLKKSIKYPDWDGQGLGADRPPFFEAQLIGLADDVAQQIHDLDDGLRGKEVDLPKAEEVPACREVIKRLGGAYPRRQDPYIRQSYLIRGLTHLFVTNILQESEKRLTAWVRRHKIETADQFYERREAIQGDEISLSPAGNKLYLGLRHFVYQSIINSYLINRNDGRARHFLKRLFEAYVQNPRRLSDYILHRFAEQEGLRYLRDVPLGGMDREIESRYRTNPRFFRLVADYLAGMTDSFALREASALFSPMPGGVLGLS